MAEKGGEILGPEDECSNVFGPERDEVLLAAERIDNACESLFDAAHEPVAIEGGDVGPARYGYYLFHCVCLGPFTKAL